jgi:hypothetical protein
MKPVLGVYDCWMIYWTVDRKVAGSRLRFPTEHSRETDFAGAVRFAKKHDLPVPTESTNA